MFGKCFCFYPSIWRFTDVLARTWLVRSNRDWWDAIISFLVFSFFLFSIFTLFLLFALLEMWVHTCAWLLRVYLAWWLGPPRYGNHTGGIEVPIWARWCPVHTVALPFSLFYSEIWHRWGQDSLIEVEMAEGLMLDPNWISSNLVATLNVKGLNSLSKWSILCREFHRVKASIMMVQETHF